jgi:hypothetical protein
MRAETIGMVLVAAITVWMVTNPQNLLESHGIRDERAQVLPGFHDERVFVLFGELPRGTDDLIDKPGQIHRLEIEFELAGFDLGEVQDLVDEAQEVGAGGVDAAQRFQRPFRAEACGFAIASGLSSRRALRPE